MLRLLVIVGAIFDKRNWIFLVALIPAIIAGAIGLILTDRSHRFPALSQTKPAISQPAATPGPGSGPAAAAAAPATPGAPGAKIVPRAPGKPDFAVKTALQLDGTLRPGDYVWDDRRVPPGHVAIVVDLGAQLVYVYRGGDEIGRSTLIYGDDRKPTPYGIFPILEKDADHYSSTYGNAPMPHMLRLTPDGVSLHGTAFIDPDYATHGCIGLPKTFARLLFNQAKVGDYVKITNHWVPGKA